MTRLLFALTGLVVAVAAAWFAGAAVVVFCLHYPGVPALAAVAALMAREAVNPSPLTQRLRSLS